MNELTLSAWKAVLRSFYEAVPPMTILLQAAAQRETSRRATVRLEYVPIVGTWAGVKSQAESEIITHTPKQFPLYNFLHYGT